MCQRKARNLLVSWRRRSLC
ncbi:unnamed protein product [Timema podura]|uniref:Uncharacterized protein n=1 Tax=Timema podura TaxID=61482 RepID=A0ABN7PHX1_TIMPD|nr:unnamed protein product [Timema podura]